jgi:hypothetical protein
MNAMREADQPVSADDLPALELRCDSLQALVSELLLKNQELRQRLAQLEPYATRQAQQSCGLR